VGKVLLAFAPGPVVEEVAGDLPRHTVCTVTDARLLHRQLEQIRRTGLARSAQEHRMGVSSVAVPVHGHDGVVAAIGLLAPLTSPRLASGLPHLRAAAASVSADFLRSGLEAPSPEEPRTGSRARGGKPSG
jgi:DNA-binding IclR family transcriptional regulator